MNSKYLAYGLLLPISLLLITCDGDTPSSTADNASMITLTAAETGIDFANTLVEGQQLNIIEYLYYYNGGGVAIGDVDNDGLEDLYFTANQGPDKLYRNTGKLTFEDISQSAGIAADNTWSSGVAMEDLNNDGFLDIYVCKVGVLAEAHNLVYINQQDGTFKESSAALGLDFQGFSTQVAFLDYDHDGDLDIYLLNHNIHSVRSYGKVSKRQDRDPYAGDRFYENRMNEAEQKFVEVTQETGIYNSPLGYGLTATCADLNNDGWTDIYIGNDFHENDYIYFNNGDKTFTEAIADWTDHTTQFSMGVDIADINNDLLPDIFSTDMLPFEEEVYLKSGGEDTDQIRRIKDDLGFEAQYARNHFQLNTGLGSFLDIALQTRTFATDWSWAVLLQDFDNNGLKDIFITNGIVKRPNNLDYISFLNSEVIAQYEDGDAERTKKLIEKLPSQKLNNILFSQTEALQFTDIATSQVGQPSFSNGAAYADLDQDGYLEIVVNNINEPATILTHNLNGGAAKNYLTLSLNDPAGKTSKGTKVYAYAGGQQYYQELQSVKGYQSSSSHRMHFGLNDASIVDSLIIVWPDLTRQVLSGVAVNTTLQVDKTATGQQAQLQAISINNKRFDVLPLAHTENIYNDDEKEKLILEKLSTEGPTVLYEDLNSDGIKDLYIGGSHGYAARLLQGKANGSFENLEIEAFTQDALHEDASVATIDFDGDGDRDLYVASGGGGAKELDKALEDRLYLNNGNMDFRRIPLSLPHTNGSVVKIADFDQDGYEDIFVGARSIPGYYGLSPYSFVLKNKAGMGVDIALRERLGMITDASWADIDQDEDLDLIVCGDWMAVTMIQNDGNGGLQENKSLPQRTGFWNTLELVDLNEDGQLDILAGNQGTNSLFQASRETPVQLYLGDFDNNGAVDPLVFFRYFDRYIPLGSKDKYLSQLPALKKNFVSYQDFAQVSSFEELITEGQDQLVETKSVNELQSMAFVSSSDGYTAVPLSAEMQLLNIQDFHLQDDGTLLYLASSQELTAVQANSMTVKMGMATNFDKSTNTFQRNQWLQAPNTNSARALVPLESGQYLILTNGDYP
ncbi:MAG: VCBS repeat-containing protein, partial [Bacteroidota bacterium]